MTRIHRIFALSTAALIVAIVAGARTGRADVEIRFDLSGSEVSALQGLIQVPAGGMLGAASATLRVPGDASGIRNGPASVEELTLQRMVVEATPLDLFTIFGIATASQIGTATGELVDQQTLLVPITSPLDLFVDGRLTCSPAEYCDVVGASPIDLTGPQSFAPLILGLHDLEVVGGAWLSGQVELMVGGQTAVIDLHGREVNRVVPEPGLASLLGAGLLGLTCLHKVAARRRVFTA